MEIEDALRCAGPLVAAWDEASEDEEWLGIFRVGAQGAHLLAYERMPPERRAAWEIELRRRGARVGATYGSTPWVWVADEAGYDLWSLDAHLARGTAMDLEWSGSRVRRDVVRAVASFVNPDDLSHRGVRLDLAGGAAAVLVEERDPAAALDPGYYRGLAAFEALWAFYLGRDLARWLNVPHADETC